MQHVPFPYIMAIAKILESVENQTSVLLSGICNLDSFCYINSVNPICQKTWDRDFTHYPKKQFDRVYACSDKHRKEKEVEERKMNINRELCPLLEKMKG